MPPKIKIIMVLFTEFLGFLLVVLILWANEVLDIPHEFFGSPPTPINWAEALFESVLVMLLGLYVIFVSWFVFVGIENPTVKEQICPVCKKIKTGDTRSVFAESSDTPDTRNMEQNLCPECLDKIIKQICEGEHEE